VIRYRGHLVYVVTTDYPAIGTLEAVVRAATRRDFTGPMPLGVIHDNQCVPLSPYEIGELCRANQGAT